MQDSKFFILDPHLTDEVYTPIKFIIKRRKALRKYSEFSNIVLSKENESNIIFSSKKSGVLKPNIFSTLPSVLKKIVTYIESSIWSRVNNLRIYNGLKPGQGDIVFVLLRNNGFDMDEYINSLRLQGAKICWLTSHFHLSYDNFNLISSDDYLVLDNPIDLILPKIRRAIYIAPVIANRFKNYNLENRKEKILCNGTVHQYSNIFPGAVLVNDWYTLHPSRLSVYLGIKNTKDEYFISNYSVISDKTNLYTEQRSYMKLDLVDLYNQYRFAFIGSESYGIVALGFFEAMSCGCEVFIEENIGKNIGLEDGVNCWFFDGSFDSLKTKLDYILDNELFLSQLDIKNFLEDYLKNCNVKSLEKSFF